LEHERRSLVRRLEEEEDFVMKNMASDPRTKIKTVPADRRAESSNPDEELLGCS
jgi:hypothetical protein